MLDERFIIIIWHQAGGRDNNSVYYAWSDEDDVAVVFPSREEAKKAWKECGNDKIHAGIIVPVDTRNVPLWI